MIFLYKLAIIAPLACFLAILPFQSGFCECANLDEPCSQNSDNASSIPKCCPTYSNDQNETRYLKCSTEPTTENTCVDNGPTKKE